MSQIQPYKFGYEIQDKDGNVQHRHEQDDGLGVRKGSYGYVDANGVYREVQYTADENGFHAKIKSFHKPVQNQLDTKFQSNHQNHQNHHEPHASNDHLKYQFDKSNHHTSSSPNAENIYAKSKVFMAVPGANTPVSYKQDYIYTPTRNDAPLKDNFQRENTNHLHNNIYSDSNSLPLNYEKQKKVYVEPNKNVPTERPLYDKIQKPFYREASSPGFVKSTLKYDEKNPNFIEKSNYYLPQSFESKRLSAIKNDLNDENLRNHNVEYDSWNNFPIRKYVASSSHKVTSTDKPNLQNNHTPKYDIIYSHQTTPSIYQLKNETSINQESKSPYHSHKAYKPLQKFKEKYSHLEPEPSKDQINDSANKKFKQELYLNYYNLKHSGEPSKHHNYYTTKDEIPNANHHTTLTSSIPTSNSERKNLNYELPNYKENVHYNNNHQDYEPKNNFISDEPVKFVDKNAKEYQNVNYLSYSVVKNGDEPSKNIYSKPSSTSTETIQTFKQGIKELVPHLRNIHHNHPYGKPIVKTEAPLEVNSPDSPQQKITLLLIDPKKAKYSDLDGAAANRPSVKSKFVYKD